MPHRDSGRIEMTKISEKLVIMEMKLILKLCYLIILLFKLSEEVDCKQTIISPHFGITLYQCIFNLIHINGANKHSYC